MLRKKKKTDLTSEVLKAKKGIRVVVWMERLCPNRSEFTGIYALAALSSASPGHVFYSPAVSSLKVCCCAPLLVLIIHHGCFSCRNKMSLSSILSADAIDSAVKGCQGIIFYQHHDRPLYSFIVFVHSMSLKVCLMAFTTGKTFC